MKKKISKTLLYKKDNVQTKEKEDFFMNRLKDKNGITLIALVITIIVLLILAGVTIATLTGDNRNTFTSTKC